MFDTLDPSEKIPMKKTILVIEDEKATRNNLLTFLTSEGFNAIGAENGNTGVELATGHIPDLIICDILMPGMDGYDVLFHLQQNPRTNTIPFIFLIVNNEEDFLTQNKFINQDDYVRKPITREKLRNAINSKLNPQNNNSLQSSLELQIEELTEKLQKMEEYNQAKDLLLVNLCTILKKDLLSVNQNLNNLKIINTSPEQNQDINQIQQDFASILSMINHVGKLQQVITTENYQLLDEFEISHYTNNA